HRTLAQKVPYTDVGGSLVWSRRLAKPLVLTGGLDLHWVDGESRDRFLDEEGVDVETFELSEGRQFFAGFFLQSILTPNERWEIALGGRVDVFHDYHGRRRVAPDVGPAAITAFPSDTDSTLN